MKRVRNRQTGDMGELDFDSKTGVFIVVAYDINTKVTSRTSYNNIKDLNEEWEDYEEPKEPKEYWYINELGYVDKAPTDWLCDEKDSRQVIGNCFKTKEEAERAVEKLKAWKRLKDKGFKFMPGASYVSSNFGAEGGESLGYIAFRMTNMDDVVFGVEKDIRLLFGGEDE